jgi:hypothetical protein
VAVLAQHLSLHVALAVFCSTGRENFGTASSFAARSVLVVVANPLSQFVVEGLS